MNIQKEIYKEKKYNNILSLVNLDLKKCDSEKLGILINLGGGTQLEDWKSQHIISEINSLIDGMDETNDEKDFELVNSIVSIFNDTLPTYEEKLLSIKGIVNERLKWFS